ncbi:hypothetical protein tloyanaT_17590 [Thalassotalea loyana]|jgi:hypothetical protein|uniref:Uncharacterized protein n=1 Tax=Thalassotalea loyana TaxID=280483 RepID=A0ABQ6HD43_9GAMM|nr:hypothetical protein [Thalassotalea loyana]GLX85507.1 hypothetical protein tloyanaT_17590 [Thalassotalea loyana]
MNTELEAAIRYIKHRGFDVSRPDTEYAALSELSQRTIKRNRAGVEQYFKQALAPTAQELSVMDDKVVNYLLANAQLNSFRDLLGVLCGYLLVYCNKGLKGISKCSQVNHLGQKYLDILLQVLSRKDYSAGVPIHSNSSALRYLKKLDQTHNFFDKYFTMSKGYYAGASSKRYKPTKQSEGLKTELGKMLTKDLSKYVHLVGKHMRGVTPLSYYKRLNNQGTQVSNPVLTPSSPKFIPMKYKAPYICLPCKWTFSDDGSALLLNVNQLTKLSLPSLLHVMSIAKLGLGKGTIVVPLKNLSTTNPDYGRHYNIFTRLRSVERKALGYINYDICGGIQIISFGILFKYSSHLYQTTDDLIQAYPMIFKYGWQPDYKDNLRKQLSVELGIGRSEVKELLTAYANGSNKKVGENLLLAQFKEESNRLRKEVISAIEVNDSEVRKLAVSQSKHDFPEDFDWESTDDDDAIAREKSSVYFFIWTYYEKQIRDAMLSVVDDGIPVHDAVYSKQKLPFKDFEDAILEQTGFEVKVSN